MLPEEVMADFAMITGRERIGSRSGWTPRVWEQVRSVQPVVTSESGLRVVSWIGLHLGRRVLSISHSCLRRPGGFEEFEESCIPALDSSSVVLTMNTLDMSVRDAR